MHSFVEDGAREKLKYFLYRTTLYCTAYFECLGTFFVATQNSRQVADTFLLRIKMQIFFAALVVHFFHDGV